MRFLICALAVCSNLLAVVHVRAEESAAALFQDLMTQIGEVLGGEEEEDTPTNLFSKGDGSLEAPMALHGPNFILHGREPLWLAWQGGKAPYNLALDTDGVRKVLGARAETEVEIAVPETANSRFAVLIEDAYGARLRITLQFRKKAPEIPAELAAEAARQGAEEAVRASWLAAHDNGAWRVEVARVLHSMPKDDKTAARLLAALARGWRPH